MWVNTHLETLLWLVHPSWIMNGCMLPKRRMSLQEPQRCNLKVGDVYAVTARSSRDIDWNFFHLLGISDTVLLLLDPSLSGRLLLMPPTVDGSKNNHLKRPPLLPPLHLPCTFCAWWTISCSTGVCALAHTRWINAHAPAGCPLKGKQSGRSPAQLGLSAWGVFGRFPGASLPSIIYIRLISISSGTVSLC